MSRWKFCQWLFHERLKISGKRGLSLLRQHFVRKTTSYWVNKQTKQGEEHCISSADNVAYALYDIHKWSITHLYLLLRWRNGISFLQFILGFTDGQCQTAKTILNHILPAHPSIEVSAPQSLPLTANKEIATTSASQVPDPTAAHLQPLFATVPTSLWKCCLLWGHHY